MTGQALIAQGDALWLPLPDASVDLVVTSPPYFALRAYSTGPGEIGSEATPAEFLEHLWQATAEMVRVLKPTGSIFVDLGDKYNSAQSNQNFDDPSRMKRNGGHGGGKTYNVLTDRFASRGRTVTGIPNKSLMLLPERYRIGCVDQLGLIARAVIIHDKPNGLPESVRDRVRRSHEDWVHLVKQPRYYAALDEIRQPYSPKTFTVSTSPRKSDTETAGDKRNKWHTDNGVSREDMLNPLGALPGSVWTIASEPLHLPDHLGVQHYAAFASEWPRRLVLAFSPPGICLDCGQGRVPVVERGGLNDEGQRRLAERQAGPSAYAQGSGRERDYGIAVHEKLSGVERQRFTEPATILGYACACTPHTNHPGSGESSGEHYSDRLGEGINNGQYPHTGYSTELRARPKTGPWREYHLEGWRPPPTRPAVVLDTFGGTGTVAMVARALDRIGISIDLSFPYCRAARWRVHHDADKAISRTNLERQGSLL